MLSFLFNKLYLIISTLQQALQREQYVFFFYSIYLSQKLNFCVFLGCNIKCIKHNIIHKKQFYNRQEISIYKQPRSSIRPRGKNGNPVYKVYCLTFNPFSVHYVIFHYTTDTSRCPVQNGATGQKPFTLRFSLSGNNISSPID